MDVRIDERRREQQPAAFDDPVPVRMQDGADLGDHAVVDAHVEHLVDSCGPVEDACALDDDALLGSSLRVQHQRSPPGEIVFAGRENQARLGRRERS